MEVIILGHENPDVDSMVSGFLLEKFLNRRNLGIHFKFIIPDRTLDEESVKACEKYGFFVKKYQRQVNFDDSSLKYILVDHHQREVAGKIVGVIDHHPTLEDVVNIPYYTNTQASSTSCLIVQKNESEFTKEELTLAMLAAFFDTASFHSTKAQKKDFEWIKKWSKKLRIHWQTLYQDGLAITPKMPTSKLAFNGLKKYDFNNILMESSYIQVINVLEKDDEIKAILEFLSEYLIKKKLDFFIFIVHDMTKFKSTVYQIDKLGIKVRKYNSYASRETTIIPNIYHDLKN